MSEVSYTYKTEELLMLPDVCRELGISTATGRNWMKLGKLNPCAKQGRAFCFSREYVSALKKDIKTGDNQALKSRRNKKYVSGRGLYRDYVSEQCKGGDSVARTLELLQTYKPDFEERDLRMILADAATRMIAEKEGKKNGNLHDFLSGNMDLGQYAVLVNDLIGASRKEGYPYRSYLSKESNSPQIFSVDYHWEEGEDILGLLYISCMNIGNRKINGAYYTPTSVVRKLIGHLYDGDCGENDRKVLDPCCGTGNFLLQLPERIPIENIFGNDIDEISIQIARINMALKYDMKNIDILYRNFTVEDYLTDFDQTDFDYDYIIGNPPWGFVFSEDQGKILSRKFQTARDHKTESYDVFTEQALNMVKAGGEVSFVLPEAILNVRSHREVRSLIADKASVRFLEFLGNAFDGVQCPCIILQIKRTDKKMSSVGMHIISGKASYEICTEREIDPECFSFTMNDAEYEIICKLQRGQDKCFLAGKSDFALGIVTGNNREYISQEKTDENEMILKGSDLRKYRMLPSDNYIRFQPEAFQQVAPVEYYRAKEKLLYRFICNHLVFAYDDRQTLSLNSCNILIPRLENLSCKYIMAILNSRVAQFYFRKKFNSVKVLRSHIEQIPIPVADADTQRKVEEIVDQLRNSVEESRIKILYEEIEEMVRGLFGITDEEYRLIRMTVEECGNDFLL